MDLSDSTPCTIFLMENDLADTKSFILYLVKKNF